MSKDIFCEKCKWYRSGNHEVVGFLEICKSKKEGIKKRNHIREWTEVEYEHPSKKNANNDCGDFKEKGWMR